MKIGAYINSLHIANELPAIHQLLIISQGSVSFWGKRLIKVDGYEGSFPLHALARKILYASYKRCESDDLTLQERVAGIQVMHRLRNFYQVTDHQIRQANWLTRLLNLIREFSFFPYTSRFHTEDGSMENYFRGYSEGKFVQEFGETKRGELNEYENSDGSFAPPSRILARETAILAKWTTSYAT